jgi:hypothetical protein
MKSRFTRLRVASDSCKPYVFFRSDGFYIVEIPEKETVEEHAILNSGTLKVEDIYGRVVWQPPTEQDESK